MKSYSELTLEEQAQLREGDNLKCDLCMNQGKWQSEINLSAVILNSDYDYEFAVCRNCEAIRESRIEVKQVLARLIVQIESEDYFEANHTAAELARTVEECIQYDYE